MVKVCQLSELSAWYHSLDVASKRPGSLSFALMGIRAKGSSVIVTLHSIFKKNNLFACTGLYCSNMGSLVAAYELLVVACGI